MSSLYPAADIYLHLTAKMDILSACLYIHKPLAATEIQMYCNVFSPHILNQLNISSALHPFFRTCLCSSKYNIYLRHDQVGG